MTNDKWRMANGEWQMANDKWLLAPDDYLSSIRRHLPHFVKLSECGLLKSTRDAEQGCLRHDAVAPQAAGLLPVAREAHVERHVEPYRDHLRAALARNRHFFLAPPDARVRGVHDHVLSLVQPLPQPLLDHPEHQITLARCVHP